jgi:hypothetical protein
LPSKLCDDHRSKANDSEDNDFAISDCALRSSSVEKQFISFSAGAPDQLASATAWRIFFWSAAPPAPHRCAFAKRRVDA